MGLLNPAKVVTDAVALAHRYAVLCLELVKSAVRVSPDRANSFPVQLGLPIAISRLPAVIAICFASLGFSNATFAHPETAPSLNGITGVILIGAEFQMVRIDAGRRVAPMSDEQPFWYRPPEEVVRNTVPLMNSQFVHFELDASIPLRIAGLVPQPTPIFVNGIVGVESFDKVFNFHRYIPVVGGASTIHMNGEEV